MINYKHLSKARLFATLVTCIVFNMASSVFAVEQQGQEESAAVSRKGSLPYCGLYCLYTAMKVEGKEVDFRELVKPEYLGSKKGSSLEELKTAAEDNGLYAESVTRLTNRILERSQYPVILHVKSSSDSKDYDHFVLFSGTESGLARIADPPESLELIPFYELGPKWDGAGLIVSSEPIDLDRVFAPARKMLLLYIAVGIAVILILHWIKQRWSLVSLVNSRSKFFSMSSVQAAGLAILAILCGMVYHFANDEGFLAHANAAASVQKAYNDSTPKISIKKVARLINSDTVFIDARHARDFNAGHLEGAISVPVDANDAKLQERMSGIAKDANIVVYCQSKGCPFAEKVTKKLNAQGFNDISIFKGGWVEWQKLQSATTGGVN